MNLIAILILGIQITASDAMSTKHISPIDVVNARNNALNSHDLDTFLATYADDVVIYVYPDKKLGEGKEHIKKIFSYFIESKKVSTKVKRTLAAESYVVVESATTFGKKIEQGIAIYEIRENKIQSVRFLRDTLRAKQTDVSAND